MSEAGIGAGRAGRRSSYSASRVWFITGVSAVLLAAILAGIFIYWRSPTRGLPYHDAFAELHTGEWTAYGGTWEVAQGAIHNDSDERGAKLVTGSQYWRNYSIEADVMLLGMGGDAGLIVRTSNEEEGVDAYNGYYAGLRTLDNTLTLGRAGYGWMEVNFPLKPRGTRVVASRWYHLKLLAYGCQLVASAAPLLPDAHAGSPTIISITDESCLPAGRAGLRSYSSGGIWRNVAIKPATRRDLDEMLSQGRSQIAATPQHSLTELSNAGGSITPPAEDQPPALPSSPNTQPISSLRLASLARPVTSTVRGIVILNSPALFVEDATGGVAVHLKTPQPLKVGDEVEVTGEVHADAFSSRLEDAVVRVLWEGTPMPAVSVTASQAATGAFDSTFVEVTGALEKKSYGPDDSLILDLDSGQQSFRAILNRGRAGEIYERVKPGSTLLLRGVTVVDPAYTQSLTPFAVLVHSSDDLEILAGPPWWSTGHLVAIGIGLLLAALVTNFLYHRIDRMRLRAVIEERERLAYEMHDTLAQSVAGIGFQLEAIRTQTPETLAKVHRQLDQASELVRHSHAEARRSIRMLRPQQLESEGLLTALTHTAERLVEGGPVQIHAVSLGEPRALPLRVADALYRIGQEALANAVRHAHPGIIRIEIEYTRQTVRLLIADDGIGFAQGEEQGLGLLGMRKRAASIAARLNIRNRKTSGPIQGTDVQVTAPLPPENSWLAWPATAWRYLRELHHG
ncbi:histidine kinase [Silvibacterium dinghuense]|uniref:Histidine kinase/HSP90-like ATPase domain-containing protein n=1 Tax=Silvibacterium dinghuense TaxID=1560006 RepID=A0A4Q1SD83_9BACT|nr:histidine kinase [Silvibacterium dinghuense]RXS95189.1 hypothetical protein ESZ00_11315 [Silvibacterium dinghuense]GGH11397.1 hypothetical protein GCM10011586_30060 [Silvibacterium dinghuense]